MNSVSYCIGCGCNDDYGCDGGCSWIRLDRKAGLSVCSECGNRASDWDFGRRGFYQDTEINLLR